MHDVISYLLATTAVGIYCSCVVAPSSDAGGEASSRSLAALPVGVVAVCVGVDRLVWERALFSTVLILQRPPYPGLPASRVGACSKGPPTPTLIHSPPLMVG